MPQQLIFKLMMVEANPCEAVHNLWLHKGSLFKPRALSFGHIYGLPRRDGAPGENCFICPLPCPPIVPTMISPRTGAPPGLGISCKDDYLRSLGLWPSLSQHLVGSTSFFE
jgi:hypothetical protein